MKSKLISFLFALTASLCLWAYVVTVVNQVGTDTLYNVPVTFQGADQIMADSNLAITGGSDATVNLKITCSRATLTRLSGGATSNLTVTADVSRIRRAGEYNVDYTISYPSGVSSSGVTAVGSPRTIPITVERFATRTDVPVKGVFNGSVAEGFYESPMECTPRELTVEGPESVVSRISYAQVVLEQAGLNETLTQMVPFTLVDENGDAVESEYLTVSSGGVALDTVEARQPVLSIKELPLVVEFSDGGGATADDVLWRVEPKTIMVAGDAATLATINQVALGKYDLSQVEEPVDETLPVALPNDLVNISDLQTAKVHLELDENRLSSKSVRVTDFWTVNKPRGYDVKVLSMQLMVKVRGPKAAVTRMTGENLRGVVDASSLNEGIQSVPISIEISGAAGVQTLGEYSVSVSVSLLRDEEE